MPAEAIAVVAFIAAIASLTFAAVLAVRCFLLRSDLRAERADHALTKTDVVRAAARVEALNASLAESRKANEALDGELRACRARTGQVVRSAADSDRMLIDWSRKLATAITLINEARVGGWTPAHKGKLAAFAADHTKERSARHATH